MRSIIIIVLLSIVGGNTARAQANELAQLALNIEKLAQFKSILSDLKKGYEIVSKGYGTVKSLTEGNFNIHKVFLDGLMEVSPTVKRYWKVGRIIEYQIALLRESKQALQLFKTANVFDPDKIQYLEGVYDRLVKGSIRNMDELAIIVTAGKLRMSDDERISAIDKLFLDMEDKVIFLRDFNLKNSVLISQMNREKKDIGEIKKIYGIKN